MRKRERYLTVVVDAEEFNTALYNVLLWTPNKADAKATVTGGYVRVWISEDYLELSATDDYVAVVTRCKVLGYKLRPEPDPRTLFFMTGEETKELEKNTREISGKFSADFSEFPSEIAFDIEIYDEITKMIWYPSKGHDLSAFAIAPDRFQKFSLLKPRDKYPVDFQVVNDSGDIYTRWRYGSDAVGLMKPLNRAVVANAYDEEVLW